MNNIEYQNLFIVPVCKVKLNTIDNTKLKQYAYSLKSKSEGRTVSNIGGWQSENINLKAKETKALFDNIENSANQYKDKIGFNKSVLLKITNAWININGYKDYNNNHIHPNSLISGVYYIQSNDKSGNIVFRHPAGELMQYDWKFYFMDKNLNECTSNSWWLPPENQKLYLFPSWLHHGVSPNLSDIERISISFNLSVYKY